jgi:uncharacterized protein
VSIGFAITTNGTLLCEDDAPFFARHRFTVTISLDGVADTHDRLRPFKGGRGSYEAILKRLTPLLQYGPQLPVLARVTVTPRNLGLRETLDQFIALGFRSVGFSPMLAAPDHRDELSQSDLAVLLEEMTACGREFERQVIAGRDYPFANMISAMQEIPVGLVPDISASAPTATSSPVTVSSTTPPARLVVSPPASTGPHSGGGFRSGSWIARSRAAAVGRATSAAAAVITKPFIVGALRAI